MSSLTEKNREFFHYKRLRDVRVRRPVCNDDVRDLKKSQYVETARTMCMYHYGTQLS